MTEDQKRNRLRFLTHQKFIQDPEGKELLGLMKWEYVKNHTFPQSKDFLDTYGGGLGYAGFRAGQLNQIARIELTAREYEEKVEAENRQLKKQKRK